VDALPWTAAVRTAEAHIGFVRAMSVRYASILWPRPAGPAGNAPIVAAEMDQGFPKSILFFIEVVPKHSICASNDARLFRP